MRDYVDRQVTHQSGLPHLPGVPCLHVNRPSNSSMTYVASHFFSTKLSPEWRLNPGFWKPQKVSLSPEQRCPFRSGNKYKDHENMFPGPKFVSLALRCPLNRGVPKETFHCIGLPFFSSLLQIQSNFRDVTKISSCQ